MLLCCGLRVLSSPHQGAEPRSLCGEEQRPREGRDGCLSPHPPAAGLVGVRVALSPWHRPQARRRAGGCPEAGGLGRRGAKAQSHGEWGRGGAFPPSPWNCFLGCPAEGLRELRGCYSFIYLLGCSLVVLKQHQESPGQEVVLLRPRITQATLVAWSGGRPGMLLTTLGGPCGAQMEAGSCFVMLKLEPVQLLAISAHSWPVEKGFGGAECTGLRKLP